MCEIMNERIRQIQGWMGDQELEYLYEMVVLAPDNAVIIELGAWKGKTTAYLYHAMHDDQIVCTVDTWLGQPDLRHTSHGEVMQGDIFLEFMENMKGLDVYPLWYESGVPGPTYLRMFCDDAALLFPERSIYAVIVDSDHNQVGNDVQVWSPKIALDGILCGHDWAWEGVQDKLEPLITIKQVIGDLWVAEQEFSLCSS